MASYNNGISDLEVDYDTNVTSLYESISASQWNAAIQDIHNNPDEAMTWVVRHQDDGQIMWRFLPIHSACARQPPENLINSLIGAYRQGVRCVDDQGMLPLHYACGNQGSVDVIRLLLLAYPEGAKIADPNGMLPIHYIAQWGPDSMEAIDVLLFAYHEAINKKDVDGNTPIDLAYDGEYDEQEKTQVIEALQRLSVESTYQRKDNVKPNSQRIIEHQQVDLKTYTSAPNTSDAVRRLQEAAAKQQLARETYLKNVDGMLEDQDELVSFSRMALNSQERPSSSNPYKIKRTSSSMHGDDAATVYTMDTNSQKMVESLKAEVEKLRADAKVAENEAQKQIDKEREEMQKAINEMKAKLASCEKETSESRTELKSKEEFGQIVEMRMKDKEGELDAVMKKNAKLRNDLEMMKRNVTMYKEKSSKLDEHLSALSKSMESMMEEQQQIMVASAKHEDHMKKVAITRQKMMQELIDQEVMFARLSLENQKQKDLGSEEMINAALESQKKLMASVAGVLAPRLAAN